MIEQAAVVVYGALTLIFAFGLALFQHSVLGSALAFAATGLTYIFQLTQVQFDVDSSEPAAWTLLGMMLAIFILTIASAVASTFGF